MTIIYFAGQDNFGNRGCEALIRSSIKTIRQYIPEAVFLVPAKNAKQDAVQWPEAKNHGVTFISAEPIPGTIRWWGRARRLWRRLEGMPPKFKVSDLTLNSIAHSDALVMTGGDIISLDYGLESLYYWARICEVAMDIGKPTILWAASVGPFSKIPSAEARMKSFLNRFSLITVRETASLKYLQDLGIKNVELVIDSAFSLDFEQAPVNTVSLIQSGIQTLGFNVSPLIRNFREADDAKDILDNEVADFLIDVLKDLGFKILLIPHVDPLDGSADNSDSAYMRKILEKVRQAGFGADQIDTLPRTLNAAQLKDVIRQCTYFMGARTHATVAALSQGVPTTSIAYSVKAKGINQDLFGHTRYVLDTPSVNSATLMQHLHLLINEAPEIRHYLNEHIPEWKQKSAKSALLLKALLAQV